MDVNNYYGSNQKYCSISQDCSYWVSHLRKDAHSRNDSPVALDSLRGLSRNSRRLSGSMLRKNRKIIKAGDWGIRQT